MVELTGKKTFSKVSSISKYYEKKNIDCLFSSDLRTEHTKQLKHYLNNEELGYDIDKNVCFINLGKCVNNSGLHMARFIQLIRHCFYLEPSENLKISFWGVDDFLRHFKYKRGSISSIQLLSRVNGLANDHSLAFNDFLNKGTHSKAKIEFVDATTSLFCDSVLYEGRGINKLVHPWIYSEDRDTYFVHNGMLNDLLDYGFSKEQLRQVIHLCQKSNLVEQLPAHIYKTYIFEPDCYKEIKEALYGKEDN